MPQTCVILLMMALASAMSLSSHAFSTPKPSTSLHQDVGTTVILQKQNYNTHIHHHRRHHSHDHRHVPVSTTQLQYYYGRYIDVPDGFFTSLFFVLSIALSISKQVARARLEERAWELRLEESRYLRVKANPSQTMSELRRQDAAKEYTAYGRGRQLQVVDTTTTTPTTTATTTTMSGKMNKDQILQFEADYGVDYDPYYDDPYTEEELPNDETFRKDKVYGDRVYANGEVFYYDKENNVYYRQGSRPRIKNFWS